MAKRTRSPNYPMIGLKEALDRAKSLQTEYQRHFVPIGDAQKLWGYKEHGSAGNQCVAALSAFDLLDTRGKGDGREVKLSDAAFRILLDADDRKELMQKAALSPTLYKQLWEQFNTDEGLAPNPTIRRYLLIERSFNEKAVDSCIDDFRNSMEFAGLDGTMSHAPNDIDDDVKQEINIGDFVQWTSQGQMQFSSPRRVTGVSECGNWAFVEESDTGIPVDELTIERPTLVEKDKPPVQNPPVNPNFNNDPGGVPISVLMGPGKVQVVNLPHMSSEAFANFKQMLEVFESAIVVDETQPNDEN